jgi:hypothetical protein
MVEVPSTIARSSSWPRPPRADRIAGARAGAGLDEPAQQDDREDEADDLVVDGVDLVGQHAAGERRDEAVAEGCGGAEGDEAVHLCAAVAQRPPADGVDGPADPEEHRQRQQQLDDAVLQDVGDVLLADEVLDHRGVEHRQGEQHADGDAAPEVAHLVGMRLRLGVLGARRTRIGAQPGGEAGRLGDSRRQPVDVDQRRVVHHDRPLGAEVHLGLVDPADGAQLRLGAGDVGRQARQRTREQELRPLAPLAGVQPRSDADRAGGLAVLVGHAAGRLRDLVGALLRRGQRGLAALSLVEVADAALSVRRFGDQRPVQHVHPARPGVLPRLLHVQVERRRAERRERGALAEVGEDDAGRAVAVLLPVEPQAHRLSRLHPDQARRVAALDGDVDDLPPTLDLRVRRLLRREEVPGQERDQGEAAEDDGDVGGSHGVPLSFEAVVRASVGSSSRSAISSGSS